MIAEEEDAMGQLTYIGVVRYALCQLFGGRNYLTHEKLINHEYLDAINSRVSLSTHDL